MRRFLIDFINLKINPIQFFKNDYKDKMCVRIFIEMNDHTYINIIAFTVFLKIWPARSLNKLRGLTALSTAICGVGTKALVSSVIMN
jgi:hypothetical protein